MPREPIDSSPVLLRVQQASHDRQVLRLSLPFIGAPPSTRKCPVAVCCRAEPTRRRGEEMRLARCKSYFYNSSSEGANRTGREGQRTEKAWSTIAQCTVHCARHVRGERSHLPSPYDVSHGRGVATWLIIMVVGVRVLLFVGDKLQSLLHTFAHLPHTTSPQRPLTRQSAHYHHTTASLQAFAARKRDRQRRAKIIGGTPRSFHAVRHLL